MKRPDDKEGQRWLAQALRDLDDAAEKALAMTEEVITFVKKKM